MNHLQGIILVTNAELSSDIAIESSSYSPNEISGQFRLEIRPLEGKQSIGIEEAGQVLGWNALKTEQTRVCIIHEANLLTTEAQNTLLKVVEEPSENTQIIFVAPNQYALLGTIRSRCKIITLQSEEEAAAIDLHPIINVAFHEREKAIENELGKDPSRKSISKLIEALIESQMSTIASGLPNSDMIEWLEDIYRANSRNVNKKLIIQNINHVIKRL